MVQQLTVDERRNMKRQVEQWVASTMRCVICTAPLRVLEVTTSPRLNAVQADVSCSRCDWLELRILVSDCDVGLTEQRAVFKESGGSKPNLRRALVERRLASRPCGQDRPSGP